MNPALPLMWPPSSPLEEVQDEKLTMVPETAHRCLRCFLYFYQNDDPACPSCLERYFN